MAVSALPHQMQRLSSRRLTSRHQWKCCEKVMRQKQTFLLMMALTIAITTTAVQSQSQRPNFSGFWVLDKSQSRISLPTQASSSVAQEVEHREPKLQIMRMILDDRGNQKLQLELTTDGRENLNTVDGQQLSFRARWQGNRLVVEVTPPTQGHLAGLKEVWFLSRDGQTLTIELHLRGSKPKRSERLVYVAQSP